MLQKTLGDAYIQTQFMIYVHMDDVMKKSFDTFAAYYPLPTLATV